MALRQRCHFAVITEGRRCMKLNDGVTLTLDDY